MPIYYNQQNLESLLKTVQMLPIMLYRKPDRDFRNYQEAIIHLASNTVVFYSGQKLRSNGEDQSSYDISQVCCWLSEQPLRNGMRLCTLNNGSTQIALFEEPEGEGGMDVEQDTPPLDPDNLLLISPDCHEALRISLAYLAATKENQRLIKNPKQPKEFVQDPLNYSYYIWPNHITGWSDSSGFQEIYLRNLNNPSTTLIDPAFQPYNSQDCFIYTKKTALVDYLVTREIESLEELDEERGPSVPLESASFTFKEFLFIEANPALPEPLYVMAENTIRLFRLNSRCYPYLNDWNFHSLQYVISNNEDEYDDLRLPGRMQAYKRARKSLNQLKTIHALVPDPETTQLFISQYKILMELSGYTSVWATVFNEGEDPGSFNDIMGVPAPVAPTPVTQTTGPTGPIEKQNIVDIGDMNALIDYAMGFAEENDLGIDPHKLEENRKKLLDEDDDQPSPKRRKIGELTEMKSEKVDDLMLGVFNIGRQGSPDKLAKCLRQFKTKNRIIRNRASNKRKRGDAR